MKLTPKQERFVQGIISGLSQRETYKKAGYSVDGKTNEYIDVKASELMKNGKVLVRYNDLLGEHEKKALWTREKAVKDLLIWNKEQSKNDMEEKGLKQANSNAFLGAMKELNEPEKVYFGNREKEKLNQKKLEVEVEFIKEKVNALREAAGEESNLIDDWIKAVLENE